MHVWENMRMTIATIMCGVILKINSQSLLYKVSQKMSSLLKSDVLL
jgi:hypothetical protein